MDTLQEIVINVQEIEPRLRHSTIFETFDKLKEGEYLIIHNNHDPQPVYYQLLEIRGEVFTWEYLQQGPEWWDIKLSKKYLHEHSIPITIIEDNFVINIPLIEPKRKHPTIFEIFDELRAGESLIIHNDHDPKPVYYQLLGERGDIFTWQYLQQGPEWWDVKVTKKDAKANTTTETEKKENAPQQSAQNKKEDIVINVPEIEPKLKHPTIFQVFDELAPGESLIIHNDHDPKPVYYQLLGERGDVFTWQYLEQGPEWWDVKVTKKGADEKETVGQIAAKDLKKAEVFKKYGIDFCCGGKKTVREVCEEKGIDATKVEQELQQTSSSVTQGNTNYNDWNIDFLADFIVNTHHNYVRKYLPEIKAYSTKVAQVHGSNHPELKQILENVLELSEDLTEHLESEEKQLFPLIKKIAQAKNNGTPYQVQPNEKFETAVKETEAEHETVGELMAEIRNLSKDYAIPDDACASYKLLYKMLEEFENDLHIHIHLENNILFPKTIEIEKSLA